jgi:hypothetical protein
MNSKLSSAIGVAAATVAFAVITGQAAGVAQSQTPATGAQTTRATADQQVMISGCIQREDDYRRSVGAGRGGAVATGVGVGNEFVLTNAMMSTSGSTAPAGTSGAGATSATGTAGTSSRLAYELSGSGEGQAATYIGKRVEITGKMKAGDTAGGPTGNVVGSRDLQLPELEVSSIRETTGTCATTPAAPATTAPSTPSTPTRP